MACRQKRNDTQSLLLTKVFTISLSLQLQGTDSDLGEIMTGRPSVTTSKEKFTGIPHDELALKADGRRMICSADLF